MRRSMPANSEASPPRQAEISDEIVDCGSCSACCHQVVMVMPDEDMSGLFVRQLGSFTFLRRRVDGSCVHLVDGKCSIWARRPRCCRVFHCGKWFDRASAKILLSMERNGEYHDKRMVAEGRSRSGRTTK